MASLQPHNGVLGKRLAKHLLRRATYNISKTRIEEFSDYTPTQAVAKLSVIPEKNLAQPIHYPVAGKLDNPAPWINNDPIYGAVQKDNGTGNSALRKFVLGWWLDEARRDTSYKSKASYFLFTNFTASNETTNILIGGYYDYLKLLDLHCLGDWKEFVFQMTINPIMLKYLNNDQNTDNSPNENYARELLELFTIGKGPQAGIGDYTNYTEADVQEASRVLTGWRVKNYSVSSPNSQRYTYTNGAEHGDIPCGYAQSSRHDFGKKVFSNRLGNYVIEAWSTSGKTEEQKLARIEEELREFIDIILNQDETAKYICRKLYRYYVGRSISAEIESDIIIPLATIFRGNYNMQEAIDTLLKSQHFYDKDDGNASDQIIGGLVKSPLDLVLQTLSVTNYLVPDPIAEGEIHYRNFYLFQIIRAILDLSGQSPFDPPSVAGFPANYERPDYDKFWFNSATLIHRYNIADILLNPNKTKSVFYVTDFVEANVSNPKNPTAIVSDLADLMFPEGIDTNRLNYFVDDILLEGGEITTEMWEDEWNSYKVSNNRSSVESVLKPLFRHLTWSQEYQNN